MGKAIDISSNTESIPLLEQLAGQGRGRVFELSIDDIHLGREDDNDIVIADESVSRLHAKIEKSPTGEYFISDNNSKNGVYVNKQKIQSVALNHGDIIQMGHFTFRFKVPGHSAPNLKLANPTSTEATKFRSFSGGAQSNRKRLFLYGGLVIFIGIAIMFSSDESKQDTTAETKPVKKEETDFVPSQAPEFKENASMSNGSSLEDPLIKTEKEISKLEGQENFVKEAELYFRKGQRDYFNKNYHNAIVNFDAAISLWGQHPLASYYRSLAAHDSEVEAQKHREIGLKYYNSLQYRRAMYHFKAAIDSLAHTKADNGAAKKMIQECQRYFEFSQRKLKAAELVP